MLFHKFVKEVHDWSESQGFWKDESQSRKVDFQLAKLALVHTEVSEACEDVRRGKLDELPLELADIIIRTVNFASHYGIDIESALSQKMEVNHRRQVLKEGNKQI